MVNIRLQQIMNTEQSFGGIGILFVGDFNQLGPVGKISLPKDIVRWELSKRNNNGKCLSPTSRYYVDKLSYQGCMLFSKCFRYHLDTQQRSCQNEDNKAHNDFVRNLAKGDVITAVNLSIYRNLSHVDMSKNKDWHFAPILVGTNRERSNIELQQSILFANKSKTYVFCWRRYEKNWKNRPTHDNEHMELMDPCLWQYFVPGANAFLTYNVNPSVGLANGSPVICHSMNFRNYTSIQNIENCIEENNNLPYGTILQLSKPPSSLNFVVIPTLTGKSMSKFRQEQMNVLQMNSIFGAKSSEIVVPIALTEMDDDGGDQWNAPIFVKTGNPLNPFASVELRSPFPFDLGFSMTIHKAQGRTIPRVILSLGKHPTYQQDYASIFVAFSRVRHLDHIRLLEYRPSGLERNATYLHEYYKHLEKLKRDEDITRYYNGFKDQTGEWKAEFCPTRNKLNL